MALNLEDYFREEAAVASANNIYTLTLTLKTGFNATRFTLIETGHNRETTTWEVQGNTVREVINASTV